MSHQDRIVKQNSTPSFEERVFAHLDALDTRVTRLEEKLESLEEKFERNLCDTQPIWESLQGDLRRINSKLDQMIADLFEPRANQSALAARLDKMESRH